METNNYAERIAAVTGCPLRNIANVIELLGQGATVPFIARYRKEATGSMDEVMIACINAELDSLREIDHRRRYIIEAIEASGKMTDDLRIRIDDAKDLTTLEDLFMPYKPKRRTRASVAREAGLEPLARRIIQGRIDNLERDARRFICDGFDEPQKVVAGAADIIAEWMNEHRGVRSSARNIARRTGVISAEIPAEKQSEAHNFDNYNGFSRPISRMQSHQYLALQRGENEGLLKLKTDFDGEAIEAIMRRHFTAKTANSEVRDLIEDTAHDGYRRLLRPSLENEMRAEKKAEADCTAIDIFASNVEQLLMFPPLGHIAVIGIDPGYRTGCKVVCLDPSGTLLYDTVIYPTPPRNDKEGAVAVLKRLVAKYNIKAIAVGNATAGRETYDFVRSISFDRHVEVYSVDESGASIYSASEIARAEFPDKDITVRGAISIARRLMDPMAELVKIDPKSIGVGQYQHDVDQKKLKEKLDFIVSMCVNRVGVNVNTASPRLLSYVSGIGPTLADNIVKYRTENGSFSNRKELLKVPRFGAKVYEQAAGFLRVSEGTEPLDNTRIHPEAYGLVRRMAKTLGSDIPGLVGNASAVEHIDPASFVDDHFGFETLKDIIEELRRPALDPRVEADTPSFDVDVNTFEDLRPGMTLAGKITNITAFGAFVNIGVKENGLIHISQMGGRFVRSVSEVVRIGQNVTVEVLDIDETRRRISLKLVK